MDYQAVGRMPIFTRENRDKIRLGIKTQTRRVVKGEFLDIVDRFIAPVYSGIWTGYHNSTACFKTKCPYGASGDIRVMPEPLYHDQYERCHYKDDSAKISTSILKYWRWQNPILSSMFMPTALGRTLVRYTDIRVERLQDISDEDAIAEGCQSVIRSYGVAWRDYSGAPGAYFTNPRQSFFSLWDSINGKKYPWESNPWVWILEWELLDRGGT